MLAVRSEKVWLHNLYNVVFAAQAVVRNPVPISTKTLLDRVLALLLLPFVLPVIAVLWCLVRLDGGPGLFKHTRIGQNGRQFECWKLRTMVVDAEARLQHWYATNADAAADFSRDFKLRDDPRVTPVGRFLRYTSLDELPQLFNVLKGDMSLVGPRPITAAELNRYARAHAVPAYIACKPGITGLWQISGRNDLDYTQRIALDKLYCEQRNMVLDMRILWRTLWMLVLRPNGH